MGDEGIYVLSKNAPGLDPELGNLDLRTVIGVIPVGAGAAEI